MERPSDVPRCKHDQSIMTCADCARESRAIRALVKPLEDEYWERRGATDLLHLLYRAYCMGLEAQPQEQTSEK